MALSEITKITGPGIHTLSNVLSHNIKSSGIITATKFVGPVEGSITATDATFSGNVSIAGTLTYEDVTNIDSVGIITAPAVDVDDFLDVGSNIKLGNAGVITATSFRGDGSQLTGIVAGLSTISGVVNVVNDLDVDGHTNLDNVSIAGVTTFASNVFLGDNDRILFGDGGLSDAHVRYDGNHLQFGVASGQFRVSADTSSFVNYAGTQTLATINSTGVSIPLNLDVDGHTNLDNLSVAGVSTFSGIVAAGVGSTAITLDNSHKITFGSAHELEMFHDGSNSYIKQRWLAYPSQLNIISENSQLNLMSGSGGNAHGGYENAITCHNNGAVKLYYAGVGPHLETYGAGVTVQGNIQLGDKLIHNSDTDTCVRFPAADTITAETAGTERLRITSSGEVKIMNTSGTVGLYFQSSSGAVSNFRAIGTNNQSLGYFFGNTEKVRFASNGNVNIGTGELDQTDRMLNVYGGRARISGITAGNSFEIYASNTSGQSY